MIVIKALNMIKHEGKKAFKKYILKDPFLVALGKWYSDGGDNALRYNYDLNENSIVFDVGGYEGEFTQKIYDKYQANIHVFEPVNHFHQIISNKFKNNSKIVIIPAGLSNKEQTAHISLEADASSVVKDSKNSEEIRLIDIKQYIEVNKIPHIDLIKLNIEGGEYDLLERIIEMDFLKNCKNLQIQFHNFFPDAPERREKIREILQKTHRCTYEYFFVWENWELK